MYIKITIISMTIIDLLVSQTAPLANGGSKLVSTVKLDVLDGVTESEFVHTGAPRNVSTNLDNWHLVNKLFGI